MIDPNLDQQANDQQQEEESKDPVDEAVNNTSRVNGVWGPFGFRRDATNYSMT